AVSAALDKDLGCVESCFEQREDCNAVPKADLDAALRACTATRNVALAACHANDGPTLDTCVEAAFAAAFQCGEAAIAQSLPSFASCTATHAGCLHACPPA